LIDGKKVVVYLHKNIIEKSAKTAIVFFFHFHFRRISREGDRYFAIDYSAASRIITSMVIIAKKVFQRVSAPSVGNFGAVKSLSGRFVGVCTFARGTRPS